MKTKFFKLIFSNALVLPLAFTTISCSTAKIYKLTKLNKNVWTFQELHFQDNLKQSFDLLNEEWILQNRMQLFNGTLELFNNSTQIIDFEKEIDGNTIKVSFKLKAGAYINGDGLVGDKSSNSFNLLIEGFSQSEQNLIPTVLKNTTFHYTTFNFNTNQINEIIEIVNSNWIINEKVNLFDGTISYLKTNDQILDFKKQIKDKTIEIEFYLAANAFVDSQANLAQQPSDVFKIIINGFTSESTTPENGYINPDINPELFQDQHLFSYYDLINATNVNQILHKTPLFENSLKNLLWFLKNYQNPNNPNQKGVDFIANQFDPDLTAAFFKMAKNVGIYGDFQDENPIDLMKWTPQSFVNQDLLEQKLLRPITHSLTADIVQPDQTLLDKLQTIINQNIFGFLPSNLSQWFYYLDLNEIGKIFQIDQAVTMLMADYDDQAGTISFLVKTKTNNYKFNFNQTNLSNLKADRDFKQFIFERSFMIRAKMWKYEPFGINGSSGYKFRPKEQSGTAWVIDRIINDELAKKDQYQFLIGTNLHVANLAPFFEKNHNIPNTQYNKYWNAGFVNQETNGGKILDQIQTHQVNNRKYDELIKSQNKIGGFQFSFFQERDFEKIEADYDGDTEYKKWTKSVELNEDNYLDLVWYTPSFSAQNIRSQTIGQSDYFFGENNYDPSTRSGKVHNAGMDFAILKITLTKEQIKQMFPSLYEILDSPEEEKWYPGLGTNKEINASSTIFSGGFPLWKWKTIKSIGGIIKTRNREISTEQTTQSYWKPYNEQENAFMNQYNFRKDWYLNPQRTDLAHGMRIEHVTQDSILHTKSTDGKYQNGGASGSLAINSRFEPVGVLFNKVLPPDGNVNDPESPGITNSISLFKHQSKFENWDGSILNDVIKKIKSENLKTKLLSP